MECIFCKIVRGEIKAFKVYEDDKVVAFLDINPCSKGHTLVIPKKHYDTLMDMSKEEVGYLFAIANEIGKRAIQVLGAKGYNLGINVGKAAGQEIMHVHAQCIPRYENDGGSAIQAIVKQEKDYDLEEVREKLAIENIDEIVTEEKKETNEKVEKGEEGTNKKSSEEDWAEFVEEIQFDRVNFSEARREF